MEKKEFQSSFSDYTDTSNCGLETERRDFEAYVDNDHIRVINRNTHSVTITHLDGIQATGSVIRSSVIFVVSSKVTYLASSTSAAFMATLIARITS